MQDLSETPKYSNVNMDDEINRMVYGKEHSLFNPFCNCLKMQRESVMLS
jgi:hypothetical protein